MTAVATPVVDAGHLDHAGLKVTPGRVLLSEWTKFRSLRSTMWTLLVAVVLMIGIGALFSAVTANHYATMDPGERARFNPIDTSLAGITFAQLAIGVLGVLFISGEYSTGMIRSSLTAVPRRYPVLAAKLAVFSGVVLLVSLVTSFAAFLIGQSLLSGKHLDVTLSAPGALRSVIGAALYLTVAGMMGVALGTILRNTAAGISTFVGAFFVIPPLTGLLPSSISNTVNKYLPSSAGSAIYGGARDLTKALSPWTGFLLFVVYAVVLVALAGWRLQRSDA